MLTKERLYYLMDKIDRDRIVHVKEVAEILGVSESTIRRDLAQLEKDGKLCRIRGGAIKIGSEDIVTDHKEIMMSERMHINFDAKRKICKKASELVKDGECVFIDGGTTLVPLMDFLQDRPIHIVTHNYLAVARLRNPKAQVTVIGGDYLPHFDMGSGSMAINDLNQFQFDHVFLGCAGIDLVDDMSYTTELATGEIKKIAFRNSVHRYLLIDSSKFQIRGFCKLEPLSKFDRIITDRCELEEELADNFLMAD